MIKLLRIDDRLIHGQVAISWSKYYNIHTIVIANDAVVKDEFLKMTLGLAKPMDVELKIIGVDDAIRYVCEHKESPRNVMVIVNNLRDAKRLVKEGGVSSVNFGNLRERAGSVRYSSAVTLTEEDLTICKELIDAGIELEIRWVPDDGKVLIKKVINY